MNISSNFFANMRLGEEFFERMDIVLRDLRADFDVAAAEHSKQKIDELKRVHIDVTGTVSTVAARATGGNGLIRGLRGTGKSHLLLLARDKINSQKSSICIYINLKEHMNIGGNSVIEERFFVWAMLKQLRQQLIRLAKVGENEDNVSFIDRIKIYFSNVLDKSKEQKLSVLIDEMERLITTGEQEAIEFLKNKSFAVGSESNQRDKLSLGLDKMELQCEDTLKDTQSQQETFTAQVWLNTGTLQNLLVKIVELLGLRNIVFFYDEWSMLSKSEQCILSKLIRALSTSPVYHWIAYVPYKSSLGVLEQAADMPHQENLDLQYIYEENNVVCKKYFNQFLDKRLESVFGIDQITTFSIIKPQLFELIVIASMGNTRDFGVILNKAWTNYKQDYLASNGKRRAISKKNVVAAIKTLAGEKLSNLRGSEANYSEKLWASIVNFIGEKKYTHFSIEQNKDNLRFLGDEEMTNLLYHRLIHLRKKDVAPKDGEEGLLSIYAADVSILFSRIYETKSDNKHIKLVSDMSVIHNQIRRYLFGLATVMNEFRVEQGRQIICPNSDCKKVITEDMKMMWQLGICPYCGQNLTAKKGKEPA